MPSSSPDQTKIPGWVRWAALIWLLIWFPAYLHTWGAANFLHLCDIAVILTCIGLWSDSPLLISSQAVSSLLIDLVWALDACWRFFLGHHLMGGTEYIFDTRFPLGVRLLSLFHAVLPFLLLWAVYRMRYDPRGFVTQSVIASAAFIGARFASPGKNINFAFREPFFHRAWGPTPIHVSASILFLVVVVYFPTHVVLQRLFSQTHGV